MRWIIIVALCLHSASLALSAADEVALAKQKALLKKFKRQWKVQGSEITRASISLRLFRGSTKPLARADVNDRIDAFQRSPKPGDFGVLIKSMSARKFAGRAWSNVRVFQDGPVVKENQVDGDVQFRDLTTHMVYSRANRTAVLYAAKTSRVGMTSWNLRYVSPAENADHLVVDAVKGPLVVLRHPGKSVMVELHVDAKTGEVHRLVLKNGKGIVTREERQLAWREYSGKVRFPAYMVKTYYSPKSGQLQSATLIAVESAKFNQKTLRDGLKVKTATKINVIDKRDPKRTRSLIDVPPTDDLMARIRASLGN